MLKLILFILFYCNIIYSFVLILDNKNNSIYNNSECGGPIKLNDLKTYPPCKNIYDIGLRSREITTYGVNLTIKIIYNDINNSFSIDTFGYIGDIFLNVEFSVVDNKLNIIDEKINILFLKSEIPFIYFTSNFNLIINNFNFIKNRNTGVVPPIISSNISNIGSIYFNNCYFSNNLVPTIINNNIYFNGDSISFNSCIFDQLIFISYFNNVIYNNCNFNNLNKIKINNCKNLFINNSYYNNDQDPNPIILNNIENFEINNFTINTYLRDTFFTINNLNDSFNGLRMNINSLNLLNSTYGLNDIKIFNIFQNFGNQNIKFQNCIFNLNKTLTQNFKITLISYLNNLKNNISLINVETNNIISNIIKSSNSNIYLINSNITTNGSIIEGIKNNIYSFNSTFNNLIYNFLIEPYCNILNNYTECKQIIIKNDTNSDFKSSSNDSRNNSYNKINNILNKIKDKLIQIIIPISLFSLLFLIIGIIFIIIKKKRKNQLKRNIEKEKNKNKMFNEILDNEIGMVEKEIEMDKINNGIYSNFINDNEQASTD